MGKRKNITFKLKAKTHNLLTLRLLQFHNGWKMNKIHFQDSFFKNTLFQECFLLQKNVWFFWKIVYSKQKDKSWKNNLHTMNLNKCKNAIMTYFGEWFIGLYKLHRFLGNYIINRKSKKHGGNTLPCFVYLISKNYLFRMKKLVRRKVVNGENL